MFKAFFPMLKLALLCTILHISDVPVRTWEMRTLSGILSRLTYSFKCCIIFKLWCPRSHCIMCTLTIYNLVVSSFHAQLFYWNFLVCGIKTRILFYCIISLTGTVRFAATFTLPKGWISYSSTCGGASIKPWWISSGLMLY